MGTFCDAREKVRRHFALTNLERTPIGVAACPSSVVPGGDAHVRMPELATHVAKLDPRCEKLRRERIPQVFRSSGSGSAVRPQYLPNTRRLAELPKVALPVVAVIHRSNWAVLRPALLELEGE